MDDAAAAILEADGYAGVGEDLDELLTMPDVACDDPAEEIVEDRTLRVRSKSKRQLILEAASAKHQRSHYPHNPFCEICCRAHMRQHSMHCKRERGDDELPPVTAPMQRMSADHVINQRSASSDGAAGLEDYVCFSIRD